MSAVVHRFKDSGGEAGTSFVVSVVRNLDWLYRHSVECARITLSYSQFNEYGNPVTLNGEPSTCLLMVAESRKRPDGSYWRYTCTWGDISLARGFLHRPSYDLAFRYDLTKHGDENTVEVPAQRTTGVSQRAGVDCAICGHLAHHSIPCALCACVNRPAYVRPSNATHGPVGWRVLVNYGAGDGWEFEVWESSAREARQRVREYRDNAYGRYDVTMRRGRPE